MPIAVVVSSANDKGKKHAPALLGNVAKGPSRFKVVVADSQYSSENVRNCIREMEASPVVPYMSNQAKGMPVLRVDKFFRAYGGTEEERKLYGLGRASVERVNSRLELVGLDGLKVRGLRNVLMYVLLCVIVVLLVAVAAHRLGRLHKARSGARS